MKALSRIQFQRVYLTLLSILGPFQFHPSEEYRQVERLLPKCLFPCLAADPNHLPYLWDELMLLFQLKLKKHHPVPALQVMYLQLERVSLPRQNLKSSIRIA